MRAERHREISLTSHRVTTRTAPCHSPFGGREAEAHGIDAATTQEAPQRHRPRVGVGRIDALRSQALKIDRRRRHPANRLVQMVLQRSLWAFPFERATGEARWYGHRRQPSRIGTPGS